MDKILRLYTYIDGVNDTPFPSEENHATLTSFQYDSKRMGGAPTISATLMHEQCLDRLWTYNVYAQFNGEKYFIKNIPSSQYSNNDVLYKHELVLVSERVILDNVYFYDVVSSNAENDKPVSNSTKFTFFGDIHEFAQRLNYSLQYRKVGYSVVVDEGISSEGKMVSFEDAVFSNAIQESYNTYEIPYYFVGKVIHFGFTSNAITETFRYGADESLLSIQKSNANTKVVTRITGTGSSDNIPYYYPNDSEQGSVTLLYNGAETSNVIVKDRLKFTNLLLENKLLYTYKASAQTTLTNRLTVSSYTDITQNADARKMYYFNVEGKFTVEKSSDITLSLQIGNNSSTILRIENAAGTEQLYRQISGDSTTIYTKLSAGVFTIYLYVTAEMRDDEVIEDLSGAQTYIERSIHLSIKSKSEEQKYWSLNDKVVFLSDYGLELSSGFVPSNGDYISIRQDEYIQPSDKLLPPIYRETKGAERFYEAKNNTYINPQTGEYYHFNNEFAEGNPKEHIVSFDNIKPTIKGMTNALGYRIDMFQEFAYDLNDNDDTYPEGSEKAGEYIHPYFFAKLRKFDGDYGFNLFDHAIDEGEMTISMTSGNCGACEWVIGVDENTNKNIVQVDSDGNLYRDEQGNVLLGAPQDRQNDTQNYEVWIALKKDINTFGVIMPNATYNYKPSVNDTFVILHIDLPKAYVLAAENRLKEELIKYMATNNDEKFNFSVSFSRIYFAENPNVLAKLNENARLQIEYDGTTYELYVSSYSYKMSNNSPLPEIQVELSDTLAVSQNALQTAINKVEQDIMRNVGSIDWLKLGLAYFLRKDVDDRSKGAIATDKQIEVGRYVSGVSGAVIYVDKETGQTIGELDKLYVRMKAYFEQLEIVNVNSVGGKQIISPAGAIRCNSVITQPDWDYYRCYFLSEQDGVRIENRFKVGDQAYSSMFNAREGIENSITNHYYCRLVVGRGEDYIDLSKSDCDTGSDIPKEGDVIVHRGNRNDIDRQNFIEFSSVDSFSPSITLYQGVNSYSVADKEVVQFGVNKATGKAFMNVYGDMYLGNRDGSAYISYTPEGGLKIKGTLDIGTNFGDKTLKETIDAAGNVYKEDLSLLQATINNDINNLQSQIDGAIETWFFNPIPTLTNAPAKDWTTDEQKNTHLGDLYYNAEGRAYRFQFNADTNVYYWNEIVDTDIKKALENAKKAQDTADGKRRVFIEQPKSGQAYDIGDIWVNATYPTDGSLYKNDMLRASTSNDGTTAFDISHWTLASKYTDDTIANQALSDAKKANDSVNDLSKGVQEFKLNVEGAFRDGIIDESETQALDANMKQIGALKDQVEKSYEDIATNSLLTGSTELTTLTGAKNAFLAACQELLDEVSATISDKVISDTERIRVNAKYDTFNTKYGDYNKALNACIRYVEEKLNENITTYSYLKEALKQDTSIAGGLVQTSSLVLGYKDSGGAYNVMAGSNGLVTAKANKTPAFWMGGDMIDLFDVYNSSTGEFDREVGVRYAQGMDRMDGTGYRANGNLWWDAEGRVHADPLSFFVGENTVGALLASFQVVLKADGIHPDYLIPKVPFQSLHIADTLRIGDALIKYDATNKAVYVTHSDGSTDTIGFYAEGWVSAKGVNSSSSGGGGSSALYQLIDILPNATNDGVYGATNGSVLMYNGGKWQAGSVVTDISTLTFNVNGEKLFDFNGKVGVTANIKVPTKLSELVNDLEGVLTDDDAQAIAKGIADAHTHASEAYTLGYETKSVLDAHLTDFTNPHKVAFGQLTEHPTTLAGYGITDGINAIASSGSGNVVTSISNNGHTLNFTKDITALTSHQTIYALTLQRNGTNIGTYTPNKAAATLNISVPTKLSDLTDDLYVLTDADGQVIAASIAEARVLASDAMTVAQRAEYIAEHKIEDYFTMVNIGTSDAPQWAIKAKYGFYTDSFISAKGLNSSGGSGGSGASALYQLLDVVPNSTGDGVLNASVGKVLMYNGSKWEAGSVVTDIATLTLNVNGSKLLDYNGKSGVTANISVPTKLSQLTDDLNVLTDDDGQTLTMAIHDANERASEAMTLARLVDNAYTDHIRDLNNPHGVTKAQIGLGSVDNLAASGYFTALTSTSATNLSMTIGGTTKTCALYATYLGGQGINYFATASALSTTNSNLSTLSSTVSSHTSNTSNPHSVTKAQVGLGNVDNLAASGYLTALSSSSATNLSITVGGTTKSVTSMYATYLGGQPIGYFATLAQLQENEQAVAKAIGEARQRASEAMTLATTLRYEVDRQLNNDDGQAIVLSIMQQVNRLSDMISSVKAQVEQLSGYWRLDKNGDLYTVHNVYSEKAITAKKTL